ncbi:MAG: nucleotidyltransferase domain-containing protein [Spirochaetales bacterium]|nr:nucleotidyltransferase domain-containing protein [Spirochaetales bacterium]
MEKHHQEAIDIFLKRYSGDETILAVLLGGSIAHGFSKSDSDIDLSIIVSPEEFQKRKAENNLAFSIWDICNYENGYVDCKLVDLGLMKKIAEKGSDPSRYAFKDNQILYSRLDGLGALLTEIDRFPIEKQEERRKRFASQLLAWKWYYSEGVKKKNSYLIFLAIQKIVLFSSRIVLNENALLYPYHKWLLRVLDGAGKKPDHLLKKIDELFGENTIEMVNAYCLCILDFIGFTEKSVDWPNYFLKDSEQNWIDHEAPVEDI